MPNELVEKHLHLSGAVPHKILWEVIKQSGYKTPLKSYEAFCRFTDLKSKGSLDGYLDVLHWVDKAQSNPMAIEKCVYESFASNAVNGVKRLELRFNPTKRSQEGTIDLDSIIVSARAGMERAKSIFGIEGGLILCMGRDCTLQANVGVWSKAMKYFKKGVIGIDLAGPYDWDAYESQRDWIKNVYWTANDQGMMTTIHAAEVDHPKIVDEIDWVISEVRPKRIGHGIQMAKYPAALDRVVESDIELEICISSNLNTGAVSGMNEYMDIFDKLNQAGVRYSINTDST